MANNLFTQYSWDMFENSSLNEIWNNKYSFDALLDVIQSTYPDVKWRTLPDWEEMQDREILICLSELYSFKSELIIVTDISYRDKQGPFRVDARELFNFTDNFLKYFGECMFNGDTVIFNETEKVIWVFHHDGMYTSFRL